MSVREAKERAWAARQILAHNLSVGSAPLDAAIAQM
jgi:hypothetical protein